MLDGAMLTTPCGGGRRIARGAIMDEALVQCGSVNEAESQRARSAALAKELRAAAIRGDRVHLTRLLSRLLRSKESGSGLTVALLALTHRIDSVRSAAMTDALTRVR